MNNPHEGSTVNNLTDAQITDLTDGGETVLHNHDSAYVNISGDTMTGNLTLGGGLTAGVLSYINADSARVSGLIIPPSAGSVVNYIGQAKNILTYCDTLDTLSTTNVTNAANAFDLAGTTVATLTNSSVCTFEITFATANQLANVNAFSITGFAGGALGNVTAIKLEEDFGSGYNTQFNDTDPNNSGYGNSAVSGQYYQRRFTLVGGNGASILQKLKISITTGSGTATTIRMMSAYTPNLPDYSRFLLSRNAAYLTGRLQEKQGADVASANNLVLGSDGNVFEITGTTQINLVSNLNWQNGSQITLLFTSTPTVKHNQATSGTNITIQLAGAVDFVASAGDVLTLVLSEIGGTQAWRERSRAVI